MAKYRFLYIDDENDQTTAAIADGLKIENIIDVTLTEPKDFKAQKKEFQEHLKEYDGVILDLRLDGKRLDIPYNAPALAQELRMMAIEGSVKSCPIVLCSTEEKMRATYDVDKTSHDLFDYKFHKQPSPPWKKFATKINSLATGYYFIESSKSDLSKILNRDISGLDPRIFERFEEPYVPIADYASFIIKELFHQPGPLVKERLLAARLGIDIAKSDKSWQHFLDKYLNKFRYNGAFSDGWARWWFDQINDFFKEATGKRLSLLSAQDRVNALRTFTGINELVSAGPLPRAKSTNFWTMCEFYKMPIDPLEAFRIHTTIEPKPWQESRYISLEAVINKKGPRPHSSENSRIKSIKELLAGAK